MPQLYSNFYLASQSFRSPQIQPDNESNYAGPKFPHGDSACREQQQTMLKSILTITPMIEHNKFEINIQ